MCGESIMILISNVVVRRMSGGIRCVDFLFSVFSVNVDEIMMLR